MTPSLSILELEDEMTSRNQPVLLSNEQTSAEPSASWEDHAKAVIAAVEERITPLVRKVSDDVYADILYGVQDYLKDNVLHNFQAELGAARSQAALDRKKAYDAEVNATHLAAALRMCISRIENPNLSPDANVVLERAKAIHHAHAKDDASRARDPLREESKSPLAQSETSS